MPLEFHSWCHLKDEQAEGPCSAVGWTTAQMLGPCTAMPVSSPGYFASAPASGQCTWEAAGDGPSAGTLPAVWETCMEFPAPGSGLTQPWLF